jgi:hypothetical protein
MEGIIAVTSILVATGIGLTVSIGTVRMILNAAVRQ